MRSAAKVSCCCTRALVKCMRRVERFVRRGIHPDWKVAWRPGEARCEVVAKSRRAFVHHLAGVFPVNALERGVLHIDDISCYSHYFHDVHRYDERNFAIVGRYIDRSLEV